MRDLVKTKSSGKYGDEIRGEFRQSIGNFKIYRSHLPSNVRIPRLQWAGQVLVQIWKTRTVYRILERNPFEKLAFGRVREDKLNKDLRKTRDYENWAD